MNKTLQIGFLAILLFALTSCAGSTALNKAALKGDLAKVQALIGPKVDINEKSDSIRVTPLITAAENGHTEIVKLLLDNGAEVDSRDKYGRSALMRAAWYSHDAVVEILLDRGALVNATEKWGHTALMMAAKGGHITTARTLLDHGADLNAKDSWGITALMYATTNNRVEATRFLLEKGANVNAESRTQQTALIAAVVHGMGNKEILKLLVEAGADPNLMGDDAKTALDWAVEKKQTEAIKYLKQVTVRIHDLGGNQVEEGNVNITGTWEATVTTITTGRSDNPAGSQRKVVFTIAQSGSTVSGTFATSQGLIGQIIGTVSGETAIFAVTQDNPCPAAFIGRGTIAVSGQEMDGSISGFDCKGKLEQNIVAKKR